MKKLALLFGLVAMLCATVAMAADVTGKWTAEMQGRNGQAMKTTFDLKADGDKLTGTVSGGRGGDTKISDGKIKGDNISFKVKRTFGDNEFVMNYKGKMSGDDELKLTMTIEGRDMPGREVVAKREK